jgi:hypothetical protein
MFDILRKREYFDLLSDGFSDRKDHTLKGIQDGWMLKQLSGVTGKRILEVGGGNSRVLPKLKGNQLWNVEKFEGVGNGPTSTQVIDGVTVIPAFMGEFHPSIPEVDIIFSISVVEHIPFNQYPATFEDMTRCLKPGGIMYHAIDIPLADNVLPVARERIRLLLDAVSDNNLLWHTRPSITPELTFSCDMATNSDLSMWMWAKVSEASRISGPTTQIVTINMIVDKPAR